MTAYIRNSGVWTTFIPWGRLSGTWYPAKVGWINQEGVWRKFYQEEVVATISSDTNNVNAQTYFDSGKWSDPLVIKKLIINSGVTIGATTSAYAIRPGTSSWQGDLQIINNGTIQGIGGAGNSGTGGSVVHGNIQSATGQNMRFDNYGTLRAGGGGGGLGGTGGQGQYTNPYTHYEGPLWDGYSYMWREDERSGNSYRWASYTNNVYPGWYGDWYYYRGTLRRQTLEGEGSSSGSYWSYEYEIGRYQTRYTYPITSGGGGGAGGRGQGHDGANAGGAAGAAGGTNAGTGGTGGTGGGWGATGNTGNTGASGNYSGGSAGTSGGLAGYYKYGNVTLNNYGTLQGRVA